jgi:hypothetical protein
MEEILKCSKCGKPLFPLHGVTEGEMCRCGGMQGQVVNFNAAHYLETEVVKDEVKVFLRQTKLTKAQKELPRKKVKKWQRAVI